MEMEDGYIISYEKYDDDLKRHVYNVKNVSIKIYSKSPNAYIAYSNHLKTACLYWNIDEIPSLMIRRKYKMLNEHYKYEIYEKGVAIWSSNPNIYEATRQFVHAFRNNEELKSNCPCCS